MEWKYKIVNLNMPADFIEVHVEFTTPTNSTFTKMYSMSQPFTQEQTDGFLAGEVEKLESLSTNYAILSTMLGTEFIVGGE